MKNTLLIGIGAFLAGHVVESKFNVIAKVGNVVGEVPLIGGMLENVYEFILE